MGLGIPPLRIKIMLKSNPLKSTMLVGGLAVLQTSLSWMMDPRAGLYIMFASRNVGALEIVICPQMYLYVCMCVCVYIYI